MGGDPGQVGDLVGADAESGAHRRIELPHRPTAEGLDTVVEGAHPLHRAVGDPLGQRPVAPVQALDGAGQGTVGVGALLEHAQDDLVGGAAGGRDAHRRPRKNSW